ncbi:MAG: hypothetical protein IV093_04260 [Rubrivivax sp.]|nr:hypothetical protein [Rubrivivax sp.]
MATGAREGNWKHRLWRRVDRVFLLTVGLPTVLATAYYGLIASDVYISEARFVVRSPQRPSQTGLGALLQGTVLSRSQDDTYSVHDYIRSRDALRELDQKLGLRTAFSQSDIDPFNRFDGVGFWNGSFESLHRYYMRHVAIDYDTVSSISVLTVRAYTPQDAQRINESLLQLGERLVNNLNTRSRQDLIDVAEREVRAAEERAIRTASSLSGFRSDRGVYDPDRQSALQLQGVAKVQEELLAAEAQLAQLRQVSPGNPQVETLVARVKQLRRTMAEESSKVLGRDGSLAAKSPAYDRLVLDKAFADRQLAGALTALEQARSEAARKQLYLERLVQPHLPDYPLEPRRIRSILMVFIVGLLVWGVVSLVISSVREHSE